MWVGAGFAPDVVPGVALVLERGLAALRADGYRVDDRLRAAVEGFAALAAGRASDAASVGSRAEAASGMLDAVTAAEAAALLGISSRRVGQMCAAGKLFGINPTGRRWFVDVESLERLLDRKVAA